jgi:hypothetical protein
MEITGFHLVIKALKNSPLSRRERVKVRAFHANGILKKIVLGWGLDHFNSKN